MNREERLEKIDQYGRGHDLLAQSLAGIPRAAWEFKPAPNEWSIHEVLIHMADSEMMGVIRLGKLVAEPGSTLMTYEEDAWSSSMNYRDQDVDDALQLFRLLRQKTYRLLRALPDDVWSHGLIHPLQDEPYALDQWLGIYTDHVHEHTEQARSIHQAWLAEKG
jgi:hypothetical protein